MNRVLIFKTVGAFLLVILGSSISAFAQIEPIRKEVRENATVFDRLQSLYHVTKYGRAWQMYSPKSGEEKEDPLNFITNTLGYNLEYEIVHRFIHYSNEKHTVIEDPIGHNFRIKINGRYGYYTDKNLTTIPPFGSYEWKQSNYKNLSYSEYQKLTVFSYAPPPGEVRIDSDESRKALQGEIDSLPKKDQNILPFLKAGTVKERNDFMKMVPWKELSPKGKVFVLEFSAQMENNYDLANLIEWVRNSGDPVWYSIFEKWYIKWYKEWESNHKTTNRPLRELEATLIAIDRERQDLLKDWYKGNVLDKISIHQQMTKKKLAEISNLGFKNSEEFINSLKHRNWEKINDLEKKSILSAAMWLSEPEEIRAAYATAIDSKDLAWAPVLKRISWNLWMTMGYEKTLVDVHFENQKAMAEIEGRAKKRQLVCRGLF